MNQGMRWTVAVAAVMLAAGCKSSLHQVRVERVDQELSSGNRGYLVGGPPAEGERDLTRDLLELEVQFNPRKQAAARRASQTAAAAAPRGVSVAVTAAEPSSEAMAALSQLPETPLFDEPEPESPVAEKLTAESSPPAQAPSAAPVAGRRYTVKKGDSLWKIAKRFYGDPYKWRRIYEANQARLSNPNRVRPGMVLTIPEVSVADAADAERPGVSASEPPSFYK